MEHPEWTGRARHGERPVLEVGFVVWDDFYYGPRIQYTAEQRQTLREPLEQPALQLYRHHVNYALTSVLERSTGEMVRHYRDVIRLAEKHGMPVPRSHFWNSPFILFADAPAIPFSEDETREYAEHVLSALESPGDGEIFHGDEQGWEVTIVAEGDRLYIRHANFDTQEEIACLWCDRGELVRQVPPLRARLNAILAELERALGADYWSEEPDPPGSG